VSEPPISSEMSGEPNKGTIELELTPEDLSLRYATGLQTSSSETGTASASSPKSDSHNANVAASSTARGKIILITGAFAITLTHLMFGSVIDRERGPRALPGYEAIDTTTQSRLLQSEETQPKNSPVRYKNPFDPAEIFEFPPGTSLTKARELVADLLLQRARDRRPLRATVPRRRLSLSSDFHKNPT
jgi:hypothetical protein